MNLVQFVKPAPGPVDSTLVPVLERLLEQVRSGEVAAVAFAAVHADGAVTTAMSPARDAFAMLGAIERLKLRFYALHVVTPES